MENKKPKEKRTMPFKEKMKLHNRVAADFKDLSTTSKTVEQLASEYTFILGFNCYEPQVESALKEANVIPAKGKVTMELFNDLANRVIALEKDNEYLAGKIGDLETALQNIKLRVTG